MISDKPFYPTSRTMCDSLVAYGVKQGTIHEEHGNLNPHKSIHALAECMNLVRDYADKQTCQCQLTQRQNNCVKHNLYAIIDIENIELRKCITQRTSCNYLMERSKKEREKTIEKREISAFNTLASFQAPIFAHCINQIRDYAESLKNTSTQKNLFAIIDAPYEEVF